MIQKSNKPERRPGSDPSKSPGKNNPIRKFTGQNPLQNGLQINEGGFKQLLEAVPDGLVIVNTQGEVQFVNKQVEGMFGYKPEEMLGKPIEFLIPERFTRHRELREGYLNNLHGRPMGSELMLFAARKDQTEFQVEISLNPLEIEQETYIIAAIRDVTLQRLSEKQLVQSLERYQQTLDNMLEGCQIIDFDWRYIYLNDVAASQAKSKPEKMLMRTMMDVSPGIENTELFAVLKRCMEERVMHQMENRFENPDGTTSWFELNIQPVPEGIFILSMDITERRQAEAALLESNAQFRTLFEASPDAIVLIDPHNNWTIFDCNTTTCQMNGYTRDELIGQSIDLLNLEPAPVSERTDYLEQIHRTGVLHIETYHRRKDGSVFPVEVSTSIIMLGGREMVLGIDREITERRQAEVALAKSEKRFRALVEKSMEEVSMVDADGTLIFESPTTRRPLGYPPNLFVGRSLFEIFHPDDQAGAIKLFEQVLGEPDSHQEALFRLRHQDGSWRWMEGIVTNMLNEPAVQAVVINYRDVTERKQAEEEIRVRTDELRTLYELSRALADTDDLDEILNQVNRHAVESVHTTFARVALLEGDTFVIRAAYPIRSLDYDFLVGKREPVAMLPFCQRVLEQNKSVVLRNSNQEVSSYERAVLLLDFAQSLCLLPLRISRPGLESKQALGLLMLGETRNEGREPFTPAKVRLSESIGDQAASAIRRMLLYQQTERRLQNLTALREIDQVVASSSGLDLSLQTVITQVAEQLSVDAAAIWLFNSASNLLEYSAGLGFHSKAYEQAKPLRLGEGYAGRAALERRVIHIPNLTEQVDNPRLLKALAKEPFVSYYSVPLIAKGAIKGVLEVFHRVPLEPDDEWLGFFHTLAGQAAIAIDNATLFENLQTSNKDLITAYDTTLEGWSAALDLRDKETEGHTQRVTKMTVNLAGAMGFDQPELVPVRRGALLHDIGKMGVPDRILLKPDKLTDEEWEVMRMHPNYAYQMLKPIAYLGSALDIPYCHHEKWDGTGYPRGLKGEDIPLAARVFAVVDIYDALTSDRPYRKSWTREKTLNYIRELSGTHLDPRVVEAFLKMVNENK